MTRLQYILGWSSIFRVLLHQMRPFWGRLPGRTLLGWEQFFREGLAFSQRRDADTDSCSVTESWKSRQEWSVSQKFAVDFMSVHWQCGTNDSCRGGLLKAVDFWLRFACAWVLAPQVWQVYRKSQPYVCHDSWGNAQPWLRIFATWWVLSELY